MARAPRRLRVFLNNRLVGSLAREPSGAIDFRYDPEWLDWPSNLPVSLSLPLREERYVGTPVSNLFDNLLPDNGVLRRHIAERVGAEGVDAYSLLAALGRDCVGALQFLPDGADPPRAGGIEGHPVDDEEIARILGNLARNPLGLGQDDDFRLSIAGAQEKTALLRWQDQWLRPTGATPTTHIFKPQIGQLPNGLDLSNSVENEYLCLTLTAAFGLPTAKVEMAIFGARRVLIVERFDRLWTRDRRLIRVPQEDCCQALSVPWTQKYESEGGPGIPAILKLLQGSDSPAEDQRNFLKANIVFWLLGATDGHAKNFSLFLSPGGGYRLTPLYDVISAEPSKAAHKIRDNQMKLAMAVGDSRHYVIKRVAPRHFIESAIKGGMGRKAAIQVVDELSAEAPAALQRVIANLPAGFPANLAETVASAVQSRLASLPGSHAGAGMISVRRPR
jgi:serine/threonine-protein kinase HipA